MVRDFTYHEMELQIKSWFARVRSASNLVDAPSRLEDSYLRDQGACKVAIDWMAIRETLAAVFQKLGEGTAADLDVSPLPSKKCGCFDH